MEMETSGLDDATTARLAELALGVLTPDEHVAAYAELVTRPELEAELASLRATLAALDALEDAAPPPDALRDRILTVASHSQRFEGVVARASRLFDLPAGRIREILAAIDVPESGWRALGSAAVRAFDLTGGPRVAEADCGLLSLMPGSGIPSHLHHGDEWTLVLQGRAREDDGEELVVGDLVHRAPGTRHTITAVGDEPYVFAVVLYGGFHPDGGGPPMR